MDKYLFKKIMLFIVKTFIVIFMGIFVLGVIVPYMVSQKNDMYVLFGFIIIPVFILNVLLVYSKEIITVCNYIYMKIKGE